MHDSSTCMQHHQRNNPRRKTTRPKRVQGTTTLACQCGQRRRHRCGTHPSHRFSPSQFLFSSWTRFAFLRSLSWLLRCVAPHSQSCLVDLSAVHTLWKVRISVVWFHLQQFFVQAHASTRVDLLSLQHPSQLSQKPQQPPVSSISSHIEAPSQVGASCFLSSLGLVALVVYMKTC